MRLIDRIMDLGNSMHGFDMDRKATLDRTGTLQFADNSVYAIQENLKEEGSIESMNSGMVNSNSDKRGHNPFISMINFPRGNFAKRKTMDMRFLKKDNDNLTNFDSDINSIQNRPDKSCSIQTFIKQKPPIPTRKSELFTRNPHFLEVLNEPKNVSQKDRTKSVGKSNNAFFLNQAMDESEYELSSKDLEEDDFVRMSTSKSSTRKSKSESRG